MAPSMANHRQSSPFSSSYSSKPCSQSLAKTPACTHSWKRRWVVERTHSWMNRFRRILTRWEKKAANYLALLHFACAWITYRAAGLLG